MSKTAKKTNEAPAADKAADFGILLRAKREQKQLSLGEVSERLKLPARQIEALEHGDYNSLPEPVFVRGFLRSYGRFLDLDESILNDALENIVPSEKVRKAAQHDGSLNFANETPKRPFPTWIFWHYPVSPSLALAFTNGKPNRKRNTPTPSKKRKANR